MRQLLSRAVLYPNIYVWYVLVASLDIMLTWVILHFGGREMNVMADWIIRRAGLAGVAAFKFATVLLVVTICEIVGRVRPVTGRRVATWAIAITALPVVIALTQLSLHSLRLLPEANETP